ncbi:UNVERIFIED_CONTAM: Acid phosphatase 1 [Sesamum angustifolium]|uniref:Acid phosphatase 1 n=1 Tax=Sesamum angustifolium TaxID=2727405 RepID=A0AAW2LJM3_9LAMI
MHTNVPALVTLSPQAQEMGLAIFLILATLISTSHAKSDAFNPIHLLRPRSGSGGHRVKGLDCLSWRLAVETNNLQHWSLPESCENYVGNYMLGEQYRHDCDVVADAAIEYAKSLKLGGDGKDVWVFDIDETSLSNLPYYARSDVQFGALPYNATKFNEWVEEGKAPPVPAVRRLYKMVLSLGIKPVFLTGGSDTFKRIRTANLYAAGYHSWLKLIFRGEGDEGAALVYKSKKRRELVEEGYRIVGNIGDQWSDLLGANAGNRTFKVPDPMYYLG